MNNPFLVSMLEGVSGLDEEFQGPIGLNVFLFPQQGRKTQPPDQPKDHPWDRSFDSCIIDGDDVKVIQLGDRPCFPVSGTGYATSDLGAVFYSI